MREIQIIMDQNSFVGSTITGIVLINYEGRFDGIQVNAYITGASDQVLFTNVDGKTITPSTRLYAGKEALIEKSLRFTAKIEQSSKNEAKLRLRAAIIQEHKEIVSDTVFVPLRS